jgi:tetratricopeptide (TPR) repeat protein
MTIRAVISGAGDVVIEVPTSVSEPGSSDVEMDTSRFGARLRHASQVGVGGLSLDEFHSRDELLAEVTQRRSKRAALDFFLHSIDERLSQEVRFRMAQMLNRVMTTDGLLTSVLDVLLSAPLPNSAGLRTAIQMSTDANLTNALSAFVTVQSSQTAVHAVQLSWERLAVDEPDTFVTGIELERLLASHGHFSRAVRAISQGTSVDEVIFDILRDDLVEATPSGREMVMLWASRLAEVAGRAGSQPTIQLKGLNKRRRGRAISRPRAFDPNSIERQHDAIETAILRQDTRSIETYVEDLIEYQLSTGPVKYLAMSLCKLAQFSKENGFYETQLFLTGKATEIASDDGWAWTQHADALVGAGRLTDAIAASDAAILAGEVRVGSILKASLLLKTGDLKGANALVEELTRDGAEDSDIYFLSLRVRLLCALDRHEEALEACKAAAAQAPPWKSDYTLATIRVLRKMRRFAEAVALLDILQERDPDSIELALEHAMLLHKMNRFGPALKQFSSLLKRAPRHVGLTIGRANVLKAMGRLDEALAAFDELAFARIDDAYVLTGQAQTLEKSGRMLDALRAYEHMCVNHTWNSYAWTGRAHSLQLLGHWSEALDAYDEAVERFPYAAAVSQARADALRSLGRLDEAVAHYSELAQRTSVRSQALCGVALIHRLRNDLQRSLETYGTVINEDPWNPVPLCGRAQVFLQQGRFSESLKEFRRIERKFPWSAMARNGVAEAYLRLGNVEKALQVYEQTRAKFPYDRYASVGQAAALSFMGKIGEAISLYQEILRTHPSDEPAQLGLARTLRLAGKLEDAEGSYLSILRNNPDEQSALVERWALAVAKGNTDADARCQSLLTDPKTDAEWTAVMVDGLRKVTLRRYVEAQAVFESAFANCPTYYQRDHFGAGRALIAICRKEYEEALSIIDEARNAPSVTSVLKLHAYIALGMRIEADAAEKAAATTHIWGALETCAKVRLKYSAASSRDAPDDDITSDEARLLLLTT